MDNQRNQRTIEDAIIELWKQARSPVYIAQKLGIVDAAGELDVEYVEMVIDDAAMKVPHEDY